MKVSLTITPQFEWNDKLHGSVDPWWIWIEDAENEKPIGKLDVQCNRSGGDANSIERGERYDVDHHLSFQDQRIARR